MDLIELLNLISDILGVLILGIVGPALIVLLKNFLDNSQSFNRALSEAVEIDFLLDDLLKATKASRIFLLNYHNGGTFYSGRPQQKVSMSFEKSSEGVRPIISSFQSIPISYFSQVSLRTAKKQKVRTFDIEECPPSPYKKMMKQEGVRSQMSIAIYKKFYVLSPSKIFNGVLREKRMIASIHFWYHEEMPEFKIRDNLEFDKTIDAIKELVV